MPRIRSFNLIQGEDGPDSPFARFVTSRPRLLCKAVPEQHFEAEQQLGLELDEFSPK